MAQLVEAGKKVVDNPTHLADFGAALTSADSQHLQAVLESKDVRALDMYVIVHDSYYVWVLQLLLYVRFLLIF